MRSRIVFDYWISFCVRRKVVFTPKLSWMGRDVVHVTEYFLGVLPIKKQYISYDKYFESKDYKKELLNKTS